MNYLHQIETSLNMNHGLFLYLKLETYIMIVWSIILGTKQLEFLRSLDELSISHLQHTS